MQTILFHFIFLFHLNNLEFCFHVNIEGVILLVNSFVKKDKFY